MSYAQIKHLNFFIQNVDEIKALVELDRRARAELPRRVAEEVGSAIRDDIRAGRWGSELDFEHYYEDGGLSWWHTMQYNADRDTGIYFGLEGFDVASVIDAGDEPSGPYLYMYAEYARTPAYLPALRAALRQNRQEVWQEQIVLGPYDGDEKYLCVRHVGSLINMTALKDPENLRRDVVAAARRFTEVLAPLVDGARA